MSVSVNWGDFDKNIANAIADVNGVIKRKAGKVAGAELAERLSDNTPRQDDNKRRSWKAQRQMDEKNGTVTNFSHLGDDVTVGPVNELGEVEVGYGKDTYWRAHFVNFGTAYQGGQHFIERTVDEEAQMAMQIYMDELKKGLKL